jgi:hypothetical protein
MNKIGLRENTMLGLFDNVKEVQAELSKSMDNLKRDLEAFNIKVSNMPGKLGENKTINNIKVEQCLNQPNQIIYLIKVIQRKFDILIGKMTNLEKNISELKVKISKSENESNKKKRGRDNDIICKKKGMLIQVMMAK